LPLHPQKSGPGKGEFNMKTLEKVSDFVGKYMAGIVIVVAALALFFPGTFSVVKTAWVNTLLGIVMFGMGLTLKPEDFKVVFSRPKDVIIGCIAQFTLMPFLAWALTQVFHLPTELAIGVILVGTCPGGTSSNVMTYLSKGDVALSVGMTAVSTVLAPFLTPLLTLLYAGQRVEVNPVNMFLSIVKVVLVPIALGFVVNHFFHAFTQNAVRVLPLISTTAIVLIICAVVSANSAKIMTSGLLILVVVILHNLLGYLRLWRGQAAEAGFHQVPCNFHRGRDAELRSGHLSGRCSLCTVSAGNHPRCCVLCVA
jgi:BASS family bile acid:Na+ symporter